MKEESVTKILLGLLQDSGWAIVAFDFPQSGTGRVLKPNGSTEKNRDSIIPDIVAVKDNVCLFFENKDRVVASDFQKIADVRDLGNYSDAIARLLAGYKVQHIFYGIGLPASKWSIHYQPLTDSVDFVVGVNDNGSVIWLYNPSNLQF